MKNFPVVFSLCGLLSFNTSFAVEIKFINNTKLPAHLDATSCVDALTNEIFTEEKKDIPGKPSSQNCIILKCKDYDETIIKQWAAAPYFTCEISVHDGKPQLKKESSSECVQDGNTFTMGKVAVIDYKSVMENGLKVISAFNNQVKTYSPKTTLPPNVIPMNKVELEKQDGWSLQYGYDASRFPLFYGAYCLKNSTKPACKNKTEILQNIVATLENVSVDGQIPSSGLWAYGKGKDGRAVNNDMANVPALIGPTAVAAYSLNDGKTGGFFDKLLLQLQKYSIKENTPKLLDSGNFRDTTGPYFNSILHLLTQALLVGKGQLGADNDVTTGYLSRADFLNNYNEWKNPQNLFIEEDSDKNSARVIFSMNRAPHTSEDTWNNAGNKPTVSEGMAYGLLISYAANDQILFDKFLRYILSISQSEGCALYYDKKCHVRSDLLMPWLVDENGKAFHYVDGGSHLTNGSATDADLIIAWALQLASEKEDWKKTTFSYDGNQATYSDLFKGIKEQIGLFDMYENANFFGTNVGVLYIPGNQWGKDGQAVFYPGYLTPQAFDALAK